MDDIRDRSVVAANGAIASIRTTIFEPEIKKLNDSVSIARTQLDVEQRNLQTLSTRLSEAQLDIDRLAAQARTALEELDKAEGSLVFAEKMLEFRATITGLERRLSEFEGTTRIVDATPISEFFIAPEESGNEDSE